MGLKLRCVAKGFTNHEQTDNSGLIYMQARFYAPMYGRFLSPDPARDQHFEQTQSWNIYSYCQNMPTMNLDPDGLMIIPEIRNRTDESNFNTAIAYLKNAPGMATIIGNLEKSDKVYYISFNDKMNNSFNSNNQVINWDPTAAMALQDDTKKLTGETQSPALGLGHELSHADGLDSGKRDDRTEGSDPQYSTKEERRVIPTTETDAAKKLGEGTRTNHKGINYRTSNSTSRKPTETNVITKELKETQQKEKKEKKKETKQDGN